MDVLQVENVSKWFQTKDGKKEVIKDISFNIRKGQVVGLIGQNGAGKTTLMKMMIGLLKPSCGKIFLFDQLVQYGETKSNENVGYLPDVPEFYNYMNSREYLLLCGRITGLSGSALSSRVNEVLDIVRLEGEKGRIGTFSRGMKQRLGIAQGILNRPKFFICDEPTSALDPGGRKDILDILNIIKEYSTILYSTHILSDVERICDDIIAINNGKISFQGSFEQIKANNPKKAVRLQLVNAGEKQRFLACLQNKEHFSVGALLHSLEEQDEKSVILYSEEPVKLQMIIFELLFQLQIFSQKVELIEPTLEDVFMEAIQ